MQGRGLAVNRAASPVSERGPVIRVIMVEDSPQDGRLLSEHLERYARGKQGERFQTTWYRTSLEFLEDRPAADLVFMDIELPGINGMDAARTMRAYDTQTLLIFVTNLAQYAVRGYEVDALDFMIKPMSYEDFVLRMDKALRILERRKRRSIYIPAKDGLTVLDSGKVVAIEIQGHTLHYHMVPGEGDLSCRGSLAQVEESLQGSSFVRISNSCLANIDHVERITGSEMRMTDGETFTISRAKRSSVLEAIATYFGGGA